MDGYAELLRVLADTRHVEHEAARAWLDGHDPEGVERARFAERDARMSQVAGTMLPAEV